MEDDQNFSPLSIKAAEAVRLKREKEEAERALKVLSASLESVMIDLLKILEASDINSVTAHGYTFYIQSMESVKVPQTLEDKKLFFEFLKDRGMFDELISINSQTLQSLYKTLSEEAEKKGILVFRIPGIEEPKFSKKVKMLKK